MSMTKSLTTRTGVRSGIPWVFAAVIAVFTILPVAFAAETHEGRVFATRNGKITIQDADGKYWMYPVADDAKITRDGKPAKLDDLKLGDGATLTVEKAKATKIDAKSKPEDELALPDTGRILPATHEGTLLAAGGGKIRVLSTDGKTRRSFSVATDAKITRQGNPAELEELRRGDRIRLTTDKRDGAEVATAIDATPGNLK